MAFIIGATDLEELLAALETLLRECITTDRMQLSMFTAEQRTAIDRARSIIAKIRGSK